MLSLNYYLQLWCLTKVMKYYTGLLFIV